MSERKRICPGGVSAGVKRVARVLVVAALPAVVASCGVGEPKPTPQEQSYRDAWAALVPPARRSLVEAEGRRHTAWSEKKRVLWEGKEFQHIAESEARKARTTQPSTKSTTQVAIPATTQTVTTQAVTTQPAAVPTTPPAPPVTQPVGASPAAPPEPVPATPTPPPTTQPTRGRTGHQSTTRHVATRPATTGPATAP